MTKCAGIKGMTTNASKHLNKEKGSSRPESSHSYAESPPPHKEKMLCTSCRQRKKRVRSNTEVGPESLHSRGLRTYASESPHLWPILCYALRTTPKELCAELLRSYPGVSALSGVSRHDDRSLHPEAFCFEDLSWSAAPEDRTE